MNLLEKAIDSTEHGRHSDGNEVFRLMVNSTEVSRKILNLKSDEPNLNGAMNGIEKTEWLKAFFAEIEGCITRNTFKFVPRRDANSKERFVTAKWVPKKKYKSNMELDKYKVRIVARGFTQTKGIDFNETSATTARSSSWRILMASAALKDWYILQADFIAAYLAGCNGC